MAPQIRPKRRADDNDVTDTKRRNRRRKRSRKATRKSAPPSNHLKLAAPETEEELYISQCTEEEIRLNCEHIGQEFEEAWRDFEEQLHSQLHPIPKKRWTVDFKAVELESPTQGCHNDTNNLCHMESMMDNSDGNLGLEVHEQAHWIGRRVGWKSAELDYLTSQIQHCIGDKDALCYQPYTFETNWEKFLWKVQREFLLKEGEVQLNSTVTSTSLSEFDLEVGAKQILLQWSGKVFGSGSTEAGFEKANC